MPDSKAVSDFRGLANDNGIDPPSHSSDDLENLAELFPDTRPFIASLRAGITVVKLGRSLWCKSRLRVLHIHPDGRSLSWKPGKGEPNSAKRPPRLDLGTCLEVRHAGTPDPQHPMYTGTSNLRRKVRRKYAHQSFSLIFKERTVDITAITASHCKVLMEGFLELCYRLQLTSTNAILIDTRLLHPWKLENSNGKGAQAMSTITC